MSVPGVTSQLSATDQGGDSRQVRLRFPARAEYITLGRLALTGLAGFRPFDSETLADLKLALTEACSNSILHAYENGREGYVEILYDLRPDSLAIEVSDDGPGFVYVKTETDDGELLEGGLGLAIIGALADEFEVGEREEGRGSRLRFVKNLG
ncbi:MAG TPA: ATP-binding protein [Gaiellaceae bacterium]|nr:ATP-binding protein [Gaiellaceae bacterium]